MTEAQNVPSEAQQQLQHLRNFVSVADAESIARAADQVCRTPSAVTQSVIELERWLGVPLFERKPRGMLLNAYGNALLVRARRVHDEAQLATHEFLQTKTKTLPYSRNAISNLLFSGHKLQLLIHIAASRHISFAAAQMNMTQPGASMALYRIETALGQSLFQRMAQGMVAMDAADRLVMRARRIFAELRCVGSDIAAISGNTIGAVVIGTLPLGRTYVFPTAIATAIAQHPGLWVTTIEGPYEQLITSLRSGDIDIVFGMVPPEERSHGLKTEPLFTDRFGVVVRAGHPLARAKQLQLSELMTERWILPKLNTPGRAQVDSVFHKMGLPPPIRSVETGDSGIIRQLLYASDMIAMTSPHQLMFEIRSGSLVELPVTFEEITREVGILVRDGAMLSPAALAVLDAVRYQVRAWRTSDEGRGTERKVSKRSSRAKLEIV